MTLEIKIFSVANWAYPTTYPYAFPPDLHGYKSDFEHFYKQHFPDRAITWFHTQVRNSVR
jgi:hypothetical protein